MDSEADYTDERKDVWYEMSDLFLDTELDAAALDRIATKLACSSFSTEQLVTIMQEEVAPILHGNLLCVAGQWGMFDRKSEVVEPIIARLEGLKAQNTFVWYPFNVLRRWFHMSVVNDDWTKVLTRVEAIRNESGSA